MGARGEERLLKDPIRCLTSLATLALQRGIPGAAVDVQSASVGYDGPDDPGSLPGSGDPPWPPDEDDDDGGGAGVREPRRPSPSPGAGTA
jgi:hypothetical protein